MTDQNNTTPSPPSSQTESSESKGGIDTVESPPPQAPRRTNSTAPLSKSTTYRSPGKRLSRYLRRRRYPDHDTVVKPQNPPTPPQNKENLQGQELLNSIMGSFKRSNEGFPEFDSLEAYHVGFKSAQQLRRNEADRLVSVVKNLSQPPLLGHSGFLSGLKGDDNGYEQLSKISKNITTALSLCLLDNECINVRSCTRIANRERLQNLVKQAHVAANTAVLDRNAPETRRKGLLKATYAIIDYIAAIIARLVYQTASGPFWVTNVLAILAARIAKMKYLLVDLTDSASKAAEKGEDTLEETENLSGFSTMLGDEEEECEEALRIIDANTKDGLTSDEEAAVGSYCVSQNKYRSGVNAAMRYILISLRLMNRSGLPPTTYEMCVVVYEIGFEGFKTVLFQDRDLEYSASSDRGVLDTAHPALYMLDQVLCALDGRQKLQPYNKGTEELETCVDWAYQQDKSRARTSLGGGIDYVQLTKSEKTLSLRHLEDIVTVMIPMIATSPIFLANFTSFRTMMALTGGVHDVVSPLQGGQFGAFCRLYTSLFDAEAAKRNILRFSKAFDEQRFSRCRLLTEGKGKWGDKDWDTRIRHEENPSKTIQERLNNCCIDMQDWVVDESSVTVTNRSYVASVMLFAAILGGSGLAMGFTVGERITGVDPFNLATYAWVLAAFVILICKSVRVEHWTWSDFLRWRVRCRSVSELASATRVHEQLVMAKLLHDDCGGGSILNTRGPYNSVFRKQTGDVGNGFSIDRPVSAATLMLSGLALLKVAAARGNAIVCLDYRRGTFLTVVEHQGKQDKSQLICDDLSRLSTEHSSHARSGWHANEPIKLKLTKIEDFKWKRVQGLYDFNGSDVVFE
ncbi:hypothetical protein F4809DRAFT_661083 [Biscogniauxia mediterranea]|nr:hypothetical protein F4809DRAFT_661083 [Biscogniauxia mediterranea]